MFSLQVIWRKKNYMKFYSTRPWSHLQLFFIWTLWKNNGKYLAYCVQNAWKARHITHPCKFTTVLYSASVLAIPPTLSSSHEITSAKTRSTSSGRSPMSTCHIPGYSFSVLSLLDALSCSSLLPEGSATTSSVPCRTKNGNETCQPTISCEKFRNRMISDSAASFILPIKRVHVVA